MSNAISIAKDVIQIEIQGLDYMASRIGSDFESAIDAILNTNGRTIICGMGKSGIIGKKIAASFASTGTPSFFMHPGEAFHGDLGMVKPEDIFIAISNSGETEEVIKLLPFLRDNGNFIIAITGKKDSTLASNSQCHLDIAVPKEACRLQLAPTSSTTATLAMGDALTVALMEERKFQPENFARFHPGGSLGRRLLSKVRDEMISNDIPHVESHATFTEIVHTISHSGLGLTLVNTSSGYGVITDGDLRRAMDKYGKSVFDLVAQQIASFSPIYISSDSNVQVAYEKMAEKGITSLLVIDNHDIVGILKK